MSVYYKHVAVFPIGGRKGRTARKQFTHAWALTNVATKAIVKHGFASSQARALAAVANIRGYYSRHEYTVELAAVERIEELK